MVKYVVAKAFLKFQATRDEFYDKLPYSIAVAVFDNEANIAQEELVHILLSQLLTEQECDDLYYFAFETNPCVELDDKEFKDLESYWRYLETKNAA